VTSDPESDDEYSGGAAPTVHAGAVGNAESDGDCDPSADPDFNLDQLADIVGSRGVTGPDESVTINRNMRGDIIRVTQSQHYHLRGSQLQDLRFYEWVALIVVVPLERGKAKVAAPVEAVVETEVSSVLDCEAAAVDSEAVPGPKPRQKAGHLNRTFRFDVHHPMYATHQQQVRTAQLVPMLAGKPPPPLARRKRMGVRKLSAGGYRLPDTPNTCCVCLYRADMAIDSDNGDEVLYQLHGSRPSD
jgi:hypothetical protein